MRQGLKCASVKCKKNLLDRRYDEPLSIIQASLEWPFSVLISSDVSLWNQCKYIAFSVFSCKILIISCNMLLITVISNETTN